MSEGTLVHCVVVGDRRVGKTNLIIRHVQDDFVWEPTGFESHCVIERIEGENYKFCIYDTTEDLSIRSECYAYADVILVCFAIDDMASFANIREKWVPEIKKHCPGVPFLVVGTKIDLRQDQKAIDKLLAEDKFLITTKQGDKLANELKATKYVETSAFTGDHVQHLFRQAILVSKDSKKSSKNKEDCREDYSCTNRRLQLENWIRNKIRMKKIARKSLMLDRLHKGFVLCCVAVTLVGTADLGIRWYKHFTVVKPELKNRELQEQNELLAEGASDIAKELKL